jgi:N4-gp56 family major capsid protein
MAVNYASKYAGAVDERFKLSAQTAAAVNNDYDFVGVKTVNVYSIPTAEMNDYARTGANRYGEPQELENNVQELTLTRDRSFTFTIDRGNYNDTQMANSAGLALQRQIDEVIVPEIDMYRLSVMCANAGKSATAAATKDNAYDVFLDGTTALTNGKVPLAGRVAFVSAGYYKLLKLSDSFIKKGDLSQDMLIKGQIGEVDGVAIVVIPDSYLPENVAFVMTHRVATCAPQKLADYKIHDNPPGINGWLVEGRLYYDAFVLNNKKSAIYVHKNA